MRDIKESCLLPDRLLSTFSVRNIGNKGVEAKLSINLYDAGRSSTGNSLPSRRKAVVSTRRLRTVS